MPSLPHTTGNLSHGDSPARMSSAIAPTSSVWVDEPQILRALDSQEEFIWLIGTRAGLHHSYGVVVDGVTDVAAWQRAWHGLHRRHRILSAAIRKVPGQRPAFVAAMRPSTILVRSCTSFDVEQAVASDLNTPLDAEAGVLFRLTLYHANSRCMILLAADHAATDGKSSLFMLEDLLALLSGDAAMEDSGEVAWLSRGAAFGRPDPGPYARQSAPAVSRAVPDDSVEPPKPVDVQVRRLFMSAEETARLRARARAEDASVHAALVTAATAVVAQRRGTVSGRCMTPIDLRELIGSPRAVGMLLATQVTEIGHEALSSFWASARQVRQEILAARGIDSVRRTLDAGDALVVSEKTLEDFVKAFQTRPYGVVISNQAGYRFPDGGAPNVADIWGAVASTDPSVQIISVITLNGRLGMTLASRQPVPLLLEDVRDALAKV
jgi:hypothetical protein